MWAYVCFDQSKLIFDQSKLVNQVFKKIRFDLFKTLFQKNFKPLSLSPTRQGSTKIFCRFPPNFLKVSLSLSRYVYITLPFALFFSFPCIISWFLGNFRIMLNLGFLINQALFYEFDQWVLKVQIVWNPLWTFRPPN